MSRSRSSVASDSHDRLEPQLLRAAEHDDVETLRQTVALARENGQLSDNFLRVGLMRACERGSVAATQYLLSQGARTDVAGHRLSPLLRAVERNHVRIVQLLLDYGASPATADKKGRTALMTAAWRNHWHVLQLLIARGADVNAKDLRRRNVLHNLAADKQCDWGEDVLELLLGTGCALSGVMGQDELGRTPLHWACATGKLRFAELLLMPRAHGPVADVDAVEARGKTALHIAAAHDRDDIVQLLLRHGADIEARSDGGWTPLHNACDRGCVVNVRLLLQAGARVNAQLLNGVTPLHLAAQAGHRDIVECLLERPEIKRRVRDNFGSTPFLRAAQFKRKDIVLLLAPFNNIEALSADARGACEGFEATVVDFGNFHNENRVKKTSVFNLLYGRDAENPRKQAFSTAPADSKATEFRWIHLPANNMAWVEALLTKSFIEEGAHDVEGFKGLEKSFNYQHRGQRTHSHFMRPLCQSTPRARHFRDEDRAKDTPRSEVAELPTIVVNGQQRDTKSADDSKSKKSKAYGYKLEQTDSYCQDDGLSSSQGKKGKSTPKRTTGKASSKTDTKNGSKNPHDEKHRAPLSLCKDHPLTPSCNVCVFMPYLHFETAERRQKMQEAIQRAEMLSFQSPGISRSSTRDEMLISAHLASSTTSLHVRRTLDQFFYPNIDTQSRDQDQVIYRYQTKGQGRERFRSDPKIFMVDQLWMWILGTNLIVTSFAQRWEQPKNDPLNVLDGIIEDINSKTREPVRSIYDLAIIITNRCSGVFDRHRMGDEEYQFLDMFESSIGIATDRETLLFTMFNRASAQASDWLKNHRKLSRFARNAQLQDGAHRPKEFWWEEDEKDEDEQPLFVDNLLDIGQETDLLAEAKDIRDELNMIRHVLQHQQHVLADFQEVICEIYQGQHRSQYEVKKRFKEQQRTIDMHLKDIDRMDKQAERIYDSITDLLDLKQKHANAFEARFARDQAAGTTRQGKTIMVFTVVTIIFLPLSFIASLFTINLQEFPRGPDGQEFLSLSYVAKYIFGIGFAISIPLIFLALSVDEIGDGCREGLRHLRRWLSDRRRRHREGNHDDDGPTVEMEKIISITTTRRSIEAEFAGTLLPVSTRGTGRA
ncbi:ankyrin repeat protein [Aspergillus clavatus NRRL 1]|uniref:Ankyrin repeat protein n=1 Tax=Aspergillus clavatus (strain ATCC 1007 / CBS 513.65 / DSM 816 / NCTC 3887 / NRRL 1 / QM 1276 / 107) TaxID=344612 RepID=A1CP14_ASPCL|nr:ankyrin repeat protein [Aspergillus clavatus NRRL 1]EAW07385.1 ankyrin repeat protein [Aspergillus clavatus NRRL 1]